MFRAELIGSEETSWEELFAGYTTLKAITFSSSVEMLLRLADRLDDMEVVFGSESHSVEGASGARAGEPDHPELRVQPMR